MAILAIEIGSILTKALSILYVVLGLGLVIFFHELGHFAVAKWCNVFVERFSIGFGPVIWSKKKGETEYALSLVPFGGYVKMLGQDDLDASQLTSEEIAQDPRSYSAKSVPQRMAIISAGVIMNVITGMLFFAIAFQVGVKNLAPTVGTVHPGLPAWEAGVPEGSKITKINGNDVTSFTDILRGTALTTGKVELEGVTPEGEPFQKSIVPDSQGTRRMIGVGPARSLELIPGEQIAPIAVGTAASKAEPPFEAGDVIQKVGGKPVESFHELHMVLARQRNQPIVLTVKRAGSEETVDITVPPQRFRTLGIRMDIGQISAIQEDSPAAKAGFEPGDKIATVSEVDPDAEEDDGQNKPLDVGKDIDPMRLPDWFAERHGKTIKVVVRRPVQGSEQKVLTLEVVPEDKPGWSERPSDLSKMLPIPALGLAYNMNRSVVHVEPGSPADGKIEPVDRIKSIKLVLPEDAEPDGFKDQSFEINLSENEQYWAYAFWLIQLAPQRDVVLTVERGKANRTVTLTPVVDQEADWFLPIRGVRMLEETTIIKADSFGSSFPMAIVHTKNTIAQIYLTLRNLFGGFLSPKELHGPIGIARVAYAVAKNGLADLLIFLGFLSINLAVLNFLPIPVLDGGHMVFLIWEGITRKRPSEKVMILATYIGLAFVLGLMIFVIYLDLFVHKMGL